MVLLSLLTVNSYASSMSLSVSLADPAWDGKNVPVGQQCKKFGGEGSTPFLNVNQIPSGTNAIIMEYSDRTHRPMDCGGHGKFGYRILPGSSSVKVPSVAGHTFDLPQGFFLIEAHRAPRWDREGAYLSPCSGGKGNDYYVTVKAVKEVDDDVREVLAETEVLLGRY